MRRKTIIAVSLLLTLLIMLSSCLFAISVNAQTRTHKYGDVDKDNSVTISDTTKIQQNLANLIVFDALQKAVADVSNSKSVDVIDATNIQMFLAKSISEFASGEFYIYDDEDPSESITETETLPTEDPQEEVDWRLSTISYEIFVRSFYDTNNDGIGDFRGVAAKVDYLKSLNVGCVWLMPIYPTKSYHGYDVMDYKGVNSQYGTIDDFDYMVDVLHQNDIKVILDFVPNHSSSSHPWFTSAISSKSSPYRDYYLISDTKGTTGSWHSKNGVYYRGDFSSSMPDLNYNNKEVWEEMEDAASYWLDRDVDGFRLDAVKHIDDDTSINHAFLQEFETVIKEKNEDAFVVGEVWDSSATVKPYYKDIDSCFNFEYGATILNFAEGNNIDIIYSLQNYSRIYTASAAASPIADKLNTVDSIFITNHDQTRTASQLDSQAQVKLAAATLLTSSGMPFIYYGEELGQKSNESDSNRREPLDWYKSASGTGMCDSNKWNIKPQFTKANDGISLEEEQSDENSIYNYYVKLTSIRENNPIFVDGTYTSVDKRNLYSYTVTKTNKNTGMFVAHNNSNFNKTAVATNNFTDLLTGKKYFIGDTIYINPYQSIIVKYSGNDIKYNPIGSVEVGTEAPTEEPTEEPTEAPVPTAKIHIKHSGEETFAPYLWIWTNQGNVYSKFPGQQATTIVDGWYEVEYPLPIGSDYGIVVSRDEQMQTASYISQTDREIWVIIEDDKITQKGKWITIYSEKP